MPHTGENFWPGMTGDPLQGTGTFLTLEEFNAPIWERRPTFEAYGGDALWNPDTKRWGEGTAGWDDPDLLAQAVEARRAFAAQDDSAFFEDLNQWANPWRNKNIESRPYYFRAGVDPNVSSIYTRAVISGTPGMTTFSEDDPRRAVQPQWLLHHENYPGYDPALAAVGEQEGRGGWEDFKSYYYQNYGTIDWMTQPGYGAIEGAFDDPRAPGPGWDVTGDPDQVYNRAPWLPGGNYIDDPTWPSWFSRYSDPGSTRWVQRTGQTSLEGFEGGHVQDPFGSYDEFDEEGFPIAYPTDVLGSDPRVTPSSLTDPEDIEWSDFLMVGSEWAMTMGEAHSLAQRNAAQEADRLEQRIEQLGLIESAGGQEAYAALGQLGVSRQAGGEMGEAEHAQLGPNAFLASSILGTGTQAQAAQVGEQVTTEQRQEGFLANTLFDEGGLQAERAREAELRRLQELAAGEEALGGAVQARSAANQFLTGQRAGTRLLLG